MMSGWEKVLRENSNNKPFVSMVQGGAGRGGAGQGKAGQNCSKLCSLDFGRQRMATHLRDI